MFSNLSRLILIFCIIAILGCKSQNNNSYNTNSILSYNYSSNTLSTVNNSSKTTKNYEASGNCPYVLMEIYRCRWFGEYDLLE